MEFIFQKNGLVLIVDGVYKEISQDSKVPEKYFKFRRTWIFRAAAISNTTTEYFITNEMFNVGFATIDVVEKHLKVRHVLIKYLLLNIRVNEDIGHFQTKYVYSKVSIYF